MMNSPKIRRLSATLLVGTLASIMVSSCYGMPTNEGEASEAPIDEPIGELEQALCTGSPQMFACPSGDLYPQAGGTPQPSTPIYYRYDSWVPNGTPVPCPASGPYIPAPGGPPYCTSVPEGPPPNGWGSESGGTSSWKGLIRSAMDQWQTATNGRIQFVQGWAGINNTILLRSLGSCGGTGDPNLPHATSMNCASQALPHEMGHALGLAHEHQRSDRDKYIKVDPQSSNCENTGGIYNKCISDNLNGGSEYGPYDIDSTLHYCSGGTPKDMLRRSNNSQILPPGCMGSPNNHDGSAAIELYARQYGWGKFVTLQRDLGSTVPWDPTIAAGVTMVGGPTATTLGAPGSLHIFSLGSDKQIWSKGKQDFAPWEWYSIGAPSGATAVGEPAAATTSGTTGMVVGTVATTSTGTKIWLREWWSNWQAWYSLNPPAPGMSSLNTLALSSWGGGRLDVFVRAADNAIWQRTKSGGSWGTWHSLGGFATTKPAAASWGANRIDLYVGSSDHQLWHRWCNSAASCDSSNWSPVSPNWEAQGGWLQDGTSPAVVAANNGWLDVFVISGDNRIHFKRYRTGWQPSLTGWYQLGGNTVGGSVGATSPYAGHIDLVARLSDNGLWHRWTLD